MQYVRSFDQSKSVDTGFPGYRAQFLSAMESALMIASHIEEGGCGPGLHYHRSDQLYYLLEGTMNVQLGHEVHHIEAGTFVFIPAGLAHRNWNDGPGAETHFEMIIPAPTPMAPIALMVDSPEEVPATDRTDHTGYTRRIIANDLVTAMPGLRIQALTGPGMGCPNAVVNYMELEPGGAGPDTHIHRFDQYYLVLEGELTVEVALQTHVVPPHTLVLLPAGVPHRQYNAGTTTERHLAVLAPPPEPGKPWDQGVDFKANGDDITGPQSVFHPTTVAAQ
ncbi:cupin domain-containing protein [Mycolicibacterium nivoides]|uniref:cupin domain-containing protein n=1 Tax=Mycolicibacterium nivoides TaxID=2487344 RepID=UPI003C2D7975